MASAERAVVLEMLRSGNLFDGTLEEMRTRWNEQAAATPDAPGIRSEPLQAGGVPAMWFHPDDPRPGAIVYLHGGGYVVGSLATHRLLMGGLAAAAGRPVLGVDYRLAPEHPHPAAIDDAEAAYRWVLSQGIDPRHVVVAGDSAGGGLTVATLVRLRDLGVPLPAGGVCISPWTDLTLGGESMRTKEAVDPLVTRGILELGARSYLGEGDPATPSASPLYADLAGLPPLLVQVGTEEMLLDDATRLATRAEEAGTTVTLEVWDEMFHVWHAFAMLLPEGQRAIERIGAWIESRVGA